jgi:hypothetical protein
MNQRRFKFLIRCILFDDRTTKDERKEQDLLAHIRDIFAAFVKNCKNGYSLGQNVTIDKKNWRPSEGRAVSSNISRQSPTNMESKFTL